MKFLDEIVDQETDELISIYLSIRKKCNDAGLLNSEDVITIFNYVVLRLRDINTNS
jgi:hypothetical protein